MYVCYEKSSETSGFRADAYKTNVSHALLSSIIQTVLSVLESHQINAVALADFTAGREFHPAPKMFMKL